MVHFKDSSFTISLFFFMYWFVRHKLDFIIITLNRYHLLVTISNHIIKKNSYVKFLWLN